MADYISREAAIRALEVSNVHHGIITALQENLRDIPAADVVERSRWISMTERQPEYLTDVLVTGRMKYEWETDFLRFVDVAIYKGGVFFETFNDWWEGQDLYEITHWMPLPEPPVEELTKEEVVDDGP